MTLAVQNYAKPWTRPCLVCGAVSVSSVQRFDLCEDHLETYYRLQRHVDFSADPKSLIQTMGKRHVFAVRRRKKEG